jgi:hypothetical protein
MDGRSSRGRRRLELPLNDSHRGFRPLGQRYAGAIGSKSGPHPISLWGGETAQTKRPDTATFGLQRQEPITRSQNHTEYIDYTID